MFRAGGIQISIINADPDLSILLGNETDIGHPIRILLFPDKTRVYKIFDF